MIFCFLLRSFNYAQIEIRNIERKGKNMWKWDDLKK